VTSSDLIAAVELYVGDGVAAIPVKDNPLSEPADDVKKSVVGCIPITDAVVKATLVVPSGVGDADEIIETAARTLALLEPNNVGELTAAVVGVSPCDVVVSSKVEMGAVIVCVPVGVAVSSPVPVAVVDTTFDNGTLDCTSVFVVGCCDAAAVELNGSVVRLVPDDGVVSVDDGTTPACGSRLSETGDSELLAVIDELLAS